MEAKNVKPKVVFTFVESGLGHIVPMQGMYEAFTKKYGEKCEIVKTYIFADSSHESVKKMGKVVKNHTQALHKNKIYSLFESASYLLNSKATLFFLDLFFGKKKKDFFSDLKELNPDLMVSSYYLPSHMAYKSNKKGHTNTLIVTYTPDNYIYPAWDRNCHLFLTNNSQAYEEALEKGFKKEIVKKVPYVFRNEVSKVVKDKVEARKSLGLPLNEYIVLLSFGAYGSKKGKKIITTLIEKGLPVHLVVVCGTNKPLYEEISQLIKEKTKEKSVTILGYTDKMPELMVSADLMVGKAGMNTVMESAYLNCPNIIVDTPSRLEKETAKFCVKYKFAKRELNINKAVALIEKCFTDKEFYNQFKLDVENYEIEQGAEKTADMLFELLVQKGKIENKL